MPSLKQISCCIQWSDTNAPFQEYGTQYGDGVVESFIVVPTHPQGFCVRLTSRGYISEGLAMVVFVDGNYQCNRLRLNLLPTKRGLPANRTEIDFLLRQQEKSQGDGLYLGRAWRFDNHNIVPEAPEGFKESHFDDLGTIEVLVLRCRARHRTDADYEGSSSGEDIDIFEDRPALEEEEGAATTTAAVPVTKADSVAAVAEAEADDMMGGMLGLFDGANDYDPRNRRSGQWVWHQKDRPQGLPPDVPPVLHAVPDNRFRTTSHMPRNAYYQPQSIPTYPNVPSSQGSKQVHFDFGSAQRREPQGRDYRSSHRQPYPTQQRPLSRERVRSSGERRFSSTPPYPPNPPAAPYDSQRVNSSSNNQNYSNQCSNQTQSPVQQQSSSQQNYRNESFRNATSNNETQGVQNSGQSQNSGNQPADQFSRPSQHSRPAQDSQPVYESQYINQQPDHMQSHPQSFPEQHVYQGHNPLPHLSQPTHLPLYAQYQAPEYPSAPPPQPQPIVPASYASYMRSEGVAYPPQVMLPQEYAQPGGYPYPYWPYHYGGAYAYPQQPNSSGSIHTLEQVSPKNGMNHAVPAKDNGQAGSPALPDQNDNQQVAQNDDADWAAGGNGANATSGDINQSNDNNWDAAGETQAANNGWPDDNNNTKTNNGGNVDNWGNKNNNTNENNDASWDNNDQNNERPDVWNDTDKKSSLKHSTNQ